MSYDVVVRALAERDLEAAEDWYNRQRPGLGREFREIVSALFDRLSENPQIYPCVHQAVRRAVLRRFPYLVYFVVEDARVVILACLDSRRDPQVHRERSGA
ncbi:MAG TPA: type II toxin-antitoxin system RelE/ParE family toxin [Thermoanaerobaculia bacterium]|nr:type II toxin-antitoxin system RelE/ParE family toxin [Thermoanaerobaculia bacterium]